MTEAEWLGCTSLADLLKAARPGLKGRKRRLLFIAFARQAGHLMKDRRSLEALEVMERHLDGRAGARDLKEARAGALAACREAEQAHQAAFGKFLAAVKAAGLTGQQMEILNFQVDVSAADVLAGRSALNRTGAARLAAESAAAAVAANPSADRVTKPVHWAAREASWASGAAIPPDEVMRAVGTKLCGLLRDVVGNPFRPATLDPAWRSPSVTDLAQAAYKERKLPGGELDPLRLGVLADALEEAGCGSADLLAHLREPGPHFRGCWAVDLVLGKG